MTTIILFTSLAILVIDLVYSIILDHLNAKDILSLIKYSKVNELLKLKRSILEYQNNSENFNNLSYDNFLLIIDLELQKIEKDKDK